MADTSKKSLSIKDLPVIKGPHKIKYDEDGNPIKPEFPRKGEPAKYDPDREIPTRLLRNKSAKGGLQNRVNLKGGGICKKGMNQKAIGKNS